MGLRRYIVLGEETETAHCPDWYATIQAAKYLGVAPYDLLEKGVIWRDWALKAMTAEHQAQKILEQNKKPS